MICFSYNSNSLDKLFSTAEAILFYKRDCCVTDKLKNLCVLCSTYKTGVRYVNMDSSAFKD